MFPTFMRKAILGALRLGEGDEHGPSASIPRPRPQPLWFDVAAPPELHCNLQLIKGALRAVPFVGATALDSALDGYSMAALVADRILRTAEEAETSPRCFALVASSSTVLAELVEINRQQAARLEGLESEVRQLREEMRRLPAPLALWTSQGGHALSSAVSTCISTPPAFIDVDGTPWRKRKLSWPTVAMWRWRMQVPVVLSVGRLRALQWHL